MFNLVRLLSFKIEIRFPTQIQIKKIRKNIEISSTPLFPRQRGICKTKTKVTLEYSIQFPPSEGDKGGGIKKK